ncbi:MAG: WecB/TagA/CpsF family glycosyltransferase [Cyanobacteria bacterium J06629_19]
MKCLNRQSVTLPRKKPILNARFSDVTLKETADLSIERIKQEKRDYICTVNVSILMAMRKSKQLRRFIERAPLIVADGQPIVWASHWLNRPLPERVTGIELIEELALRAEQEGIGLYLLGSTSDLIATAARSLQSRYPNLQVDYHDGYFSLEQPEDIVEDINRSKAKILLVGMGVPRQEVFLEQNWEALSVNLAMGVGGSFDVISGAKERAPIWVQEVGLEWFYRFLQEPQRLGMRYLTTNSRFVYELGKTLLRRWARRVARRSPVRPL